MLEGSSVCISFDSSFNVDKMLMELLQISKKL